MENPQNVWVQYLGAFLVGSMMEFGGVNGWGWGNYVMLTYGGILQMWSIGYWILRYISDHAIPLSGLIWFTNVWGSWIAYVQQGGAVAGAIGLLATILNGGNYSSSGKNSNIFACLAAIGYGAYIYIEYEENIQEREAAGQEIALPCDPSTFVGCRL